MPHDEEQRFDRDEIAEVRSDAASTVILLEILRVLYNLKEKVSVMSAELQPKIDELEAKVTLLVTASDSAEALLVGIKTLLDEAILAAQNAGATPAQLQKVTDLTATIGKEATDLGDAVEANTPGA